MVSAIRVFVILILILSVMFAIRGNANTVDLSLEDVAKQINQGNVAGLLICDDCMFVYFRDAGTIGSVARRGSLPVIQQLRDLGVTEEEVSVYRQLSGRGSRDRIA